MSVNSVDVPVSVVVPCFRCANTIQRAVDSILNQTQKPAEVILVDDASGDNTLKVLRGLESQYQGWIKIIALNVNAGAASARNAGWTIARQPYIAFLDADDSWHPQKLYIQYEFMLNHTDIVLCGHKSLWFRKNEDVPAIPVIAHVSKISARGLLFKNAFSTPTVMIKRDIPYRFLEKKRYAEDFLLWQQVAWAGLNVVRIESTLAYMHKPAYGAAGLSAQMWSMEKGELGNFVFLYQEGYINLLYFFVSAMFSIAKFFKRLLLNKTSRFFLVCIKKSNAN